MRWLLVGLSAIAACGRFGFQPIPDDGGGRPDDGAVGDGVVAGDGAADGSLACPPVEPPCTSPCSEGAEPCAYAAGSCCICELDGWICTPPNHASCPATAPAAGNACSENGVGCYYDCTLTQYRCVSNIWNVFPSALPC